MKKIVSLLLLLIVFSIFLVACENTPLPTTSETTEETSSETTEESSNDQTTPYDIVKTDTPEIVGKTVFGYGEYDSPISWESVLDQLRQQGFTISQNKTTATVIAPLQEDAQYPEYAAIYFFTTAEEASSEYQLLLTPLLVYSQAYLRINNAIVHATTVPAQSLLEAFALAPLKEFSRAATATLLTQNHILHSDFAQRLIAAGYSVDTEQPSTAFDNDLICYCGALSPDKDYAITLHYIGTDNGGAENFIYDYYPPHMCGAIYVTCEVVYQNETVVYLLSAPYDVLDSVLAIIAAE